MYTAHTIVYKKDIQQIERIVSLDGLSILYHAFDGKDFKGAYTTKQEAINSLPQ